MLCAVKNLQILKKKKRSRWRQGGYLDTGEDEEETQQHETRGEFGEASNRLILWPRFADGDARLVDQRLAFLCRHLPNVCQFHLLSIQL